METQPTTTSLTFDDIRAAQAMRLAEQGKSIADLIPRNTASSMLLSADETYEAVWEGEKDDISNHLTDVILKCSLVATHFNIDLDQAVRERLGEEAI